MIRNTIRQCAQSLPEQNEDWITQPYRFPVSFVGFQGHFPDNPVLPAVIQIETLLALAEAWCDTTLQLQKITQAKFSAMITPDTEVQAKIQITEKESALTMKGQIISTQGVAASVTCDLAKVDV
ncbi:hypothetical protein [Chrysiogenes arsenatis]|uniref:hypothetical protein n=1 Tax=Chrysiogenes arsenatis TaxID=309797 RepID=UPI0004011EC5|nr:hypothetical protein [Chrysiogenes arsenatis]